MDRLFGKELSNLLDNANIAKPGQRHLPRLSCKSTRIDDPLKNLQKKLNKSTISQNQSMRIQKIHEKVGENNECQKENMREILKEIVREDCNKQESIKDPQMVPQYFHDCLTFMLNQQTKTYTLKNYMAEKTTQINNKMRGILLDWLIDLHYKFKMFPETLFTITMILDTYLSKKPVTKDNLQLVGAAAFFIAAKYEETYQVPEVEDLVHYSARAFTKKDIIKMEADIIEVLGFDLIMTTSFRFFQALGKLINMEGKNFHLAQYVLELSLLDTRFLDYNPSLLASSAVYLINKIRKRNQSWPATLCNVTKYEEKELRGCARQLCQLLERAQDLPHTKSLKKKFSSAKYHEVTRIKLERKKQ